jgi:hypothetical protein
MRLSSGSTISAPRRCVIVRRRTGG